MSYEMKENTGSLFRNKKKTQDNHPGMTGKVLVGGITYWISAWTKEQQNGDKWLSLSFQPVDEAKRVPEKKKDSGDIFDMSEDIPY